MSILEFDVNINKFKIDKLVLVMEMEEFVKFIYIFEGNQWSIDFVCL